MNFQVGEVVKLKSGGPEMTVKTIGREGEIFCMWFTLDYSVPKVFGFPAQSLEKAATS